MKPILFLLAIFLTLIVSCGHQSADYKALKSQNDSLLDAKQKLQEEVDGYFSAINEIEQNIEKIKTAENTITLQPVSEKMDDDARAKINEDLAYLHEMLKTNREELANLKQKLKKSGFKSSELEHTIVRITKLLEEESAKVTTLNAQLVQKDSLINELGSTVEELGKNVESLTEENQTKQIKIKEQDDAIHTSWYVFGTRSELKEQKIITSEGIFSSQRVLQSDFNKNYFVRIDSRNTKSIPLYSTRAKILTSHPKSSYILEKENGNFVLLIVNPTDFWSVSKYLVIEVD
jgi:chromosome segregation ATPase